MDITIEFLEKKADKLMETAEHNVDDMEKLGETIQIMMYMRQNNLKVITEDFIEE